MVGIQLGGFKGQVFQVCHKTIVRCTYEPPHTHTLLLITLTEHFSEKDTFDQVEVGVGGLRQGVCGHWVVVQLENVDRNKPRENFINFNLLCSRFHLQPLIVIISRICPGFEVC